MCGGSDLAILCAGRAIPLILFACMPPGNGARHAAEAHGAPLQICSATEAAPLRGLLALLLRSIASPERALNFCAPAAEECSRSVWGHNTALALGIAVLIDRSGALTSGALCA